MPLTTLRPSAQHLTDILTLDPVLDTVIDSYRHRKDIVVEVSFDAYLDYILYVLGDVQYLNSPSATLKSLAHEYRTSRSSNSEVTLYQNYVKDVCLGAAKELHLAERRGRNATCIRYAPKRSPQVYMVEDIKNCSFNLETEFQFYRRLALTGYPMPERVSPQNKNIEDYIRYSIHLASRPEKEVFIIGGITIG